MLFWLIFSIFFFKKKPEFEMRIRDWSSDVCSSDVPGMRRYRHQHALVHQQHRLAHLLVPQAKGKADALEAAERKVVAAQVAAERGGLGAVGAGDRLADGAHAQPGAVVALLHPAAGDLGEAVLDLRRAPLLLHAVPGGRHQAVGAGDGPRREGVERQVFAEDLVLVDRDQHVVVVTGGLRRQRHLALDLDVAAVGVPRDGIVGIALLGDDLGAEPLRSEEHTSELQSLMSNSYAVFCLKKKKNKS